jgi:hypothetical protein
MTSGSPHKKGFMSFEDFFPPLIDFSSFGVGKKLMKNLSSAN